MFDHWALSVLYRLLTSKALNRVTLFLLEDGVKRFGDLLPREALEGLDSFFVRDSIGNLDFDGDGVWDSFRLTVTNAWFDQRITGVRLSVDGRRVPNGKIVFWSPRVGEVPAGGMAALEFAPGDDVSIIARGVVLEDGLHLLAMDLEMELVPQLIPVLPVLVKDGMGDFAVLPDRFRSLPPWPPAALEPGIMHLVPHIHYDVEWLKTRDVFEKIGAGNLLEALRLLELDPEMTFVVDQVPQMEPFRRDHPGDFDRICSLVGEGRVEPVNGMYCEPDVNLLSGESLVRQSVAWQRYAREHFGGESKCGWLIDSFGMSGQLPQIFKGSGTEFLAFSRAKVSDRFPSEFIWEGIDGSRLVATNMPKMYNIAYPMPARRDRALRKILKDYRMLRSRSASGQVFYPGGVDHGRPQGEHAEAVAAWNEEVEEVKIEFSTPSRFFRSLPREDLPVLRGEFQRELWGTYSARIELKQMNRSCEFALTDAGKLATLASLSGGDYPGGELRECWRKLMDNQFHDQICGCCTDAVAEGMRRRFEEVIDTASGIMRRSAEFLGGYGGPAKGGESAFTLVVFNPLSQPVAEWVEFDLLLPPGSRGLCVYRGERRLPVQVVDSTLYGDGTLKSVRAGFVPELPALGFSVFGLTPNGGEQPDVPGAAMARGLTVENDQIRLELDADTGLLGPAVTPGGTRFDLSGGNRLTLERDFGNLYEARAFGTTFLHRRRLESIRTAERGPLRASVHVDGVVGRSPFCHRVSLSAGSPRIDIETVVDFKDEGCRLRCVFPTGLVEGKWICEIPYGCMERPHQELPAQNFVDLSRADRGVTLINLGIPGNKLERDRMVLTLLRSTDKIFLWDAGAGGLELKEHVFRYSLYPHRGAFEEAGAASQAYRRNNPPRAFVFSGEPGVGTTYEGMGLLECENRDVMVSVMEMNPRRETVVRLWDTAGRGGEARVRAGFSPGRVFRADLLEKRLEEIDVEGRTVSVPMRPFEIATLLIEGRE